MKRVEDNLFVGNVADFGDGLLLRANGIQLVVGCHGHANFSHLPQVEAIEFHLLRDGSNGDIYIQAVARFLSHAYESVIMCITDQTGGLVEGAYLIACGRAQRRTQLGQTGTSFDSSLAWLRNSSRLPDADPTDALIAQGRRLWA